ncbi:MAG: RluA family pseudouridine synthase [Fibrobacterales bacterium]
MNSEHRTGDSFTPFKNPINSIDVPSQFTYPFFYKPHPLAQLAAQEFQEQLNTLKDWQYEPDIDVNDTSAPIGTMLGVLVVQNAEGQLGYLSAYTGQVRTNNVDAGTQPSFVPPVVDQHNPSSFYHTEHVAIAKLNERIAPLENDPLYREQLETFRTMSKAFNKQSAALTLAMKQARKKRKITRNAAKLTMSPEEFEQCCEVLKNESLGAKHAFRKIVTDNEQTLAKQESLFLEVHTHLKALKAEATHKAEALQEALHTAYSFLNASGCSKNIHQLFASESPFSQKEIPPGTGDCVAPKLLQYAFTHHYTPVCFGQFWWGHSPIAEMRKHGYFYAACHGRCKPILTHMLSETPTDPDPILKIKTDVQEISTIYEDDAIAIINKPYNLMSETGNDGSVSVESILNKRYPLATGPLLAHRLDMATSGLMIIVKSIEHYRHLQKQFINRSIKKSYIALLDGDVSAHLKTNDTTGIIDLPLRVDIIHKPNQVVCYENGKTAQTKWSILEKGTNTTRVLFEPITGRTHQLRVHAAHKLGLNTPILGDTLYGRHSDRLYLHAYSITFRHPDTQEEVSFSVKPDF